jgi:hypothetical protein
LEEKQTVLCKYCHAEIDKSAKKCKFCGEWVAQGEEELPLELRQFNWGAFLLNWIWGIMHGQYVTLLYFVACLVPVIGPLCISIWFGISGNKWAWKSKKWKSVEEFNIAQRNWVKLWFVLLAFGVIIGIKTILFLAFVSNLEV